MIKHTNPPSRALYAFARALLLTLLWGGLVLIAQSSAVAGVISGSGNWLDFTSYCTQQGCTVIGANLKSNVSLDRYRVKKTEPFTWVVYWQAFGGSVFPRYSLCGSHDWRRQRTYYNSGSNDIYITSWFEEGTVCASNTRCRSYRSDRDYWLGGYWANGYFQSAVWFTNRCIPNLGGLHTITLGL